MREPFRNGKRPKTLLSEPSPYGSCQVTVESDRAVTAAYLLDPEGEVRSSLWLANHLPAPRRLDLERIRDGLLPSMPVGHTRHPDGRRRPRRRSLDTVWFPEGDGATITEDGAPLGVLPGWPEGNAGMPGYSREALGRTPMAWALNGEDAVVARIARARAFWRWYAGKGCWGHYQTSVLSHLERRLGQGGRYWSVDNGALPRVGVVEHPCTAQRPFTIHSTVGMSCQRMPLARAASPSGRRFELAVATSRTYEPTLDLLAWLGPYPWRRRARLEPGRHVAWDAQHGRFPLGDRWRGVLLLADPGILLGPAVPDLSGLTAGGEAVRWLWIVPVSGTECAAADERGSAALIDQVQVSGRNWVVTV